MDKSKVFFTNLHTTPSSNLLDKMERLIKQAGIESIDFKDQFVAIKIHFGEPGNLAYLRPNYAARLATLLRSWGAKPFLTDCNTLYSGRRANAVDHLQSAMENGYNPISAQCQVIIADGLKGTEYREIPLNGEYCKAPKIGSALADADIVISMTHFKGHEQAGFGGALKNLGMGGASVGGKLELHCNSQPKIETENCKGCNICVKHCAHDLNQNHKAEIDYTKCVGCGQCVALCQHDAAVMGECDTSERLNYKIAEYTQAILKDKPHFHISFIMNVSPECDCWNHNDAAETAVPLKYGTLFGCRCPIFPVKDECRPYRLDVVPQFLFAVKRHIRLSKGRLLPSAPCRAGRNRKTGRNCHPRGHRRRTRCRQAAAVSGQRLHASLPALHRQTRFPRLRGGWRNGNNAARAAACPSPVPAHHRRDSLQAVPSHTFRRHGRPVPV